MHITLTPGRILGATIVVLSAWIVHGFIEALLAACVIAIASWPLYARFTACLPRRLASASPALFTCAVTVFVLAPMVFACASLLDEARSLLAGFADAAGRGLAVPEWLV